MEQVCDFLPAGSSEMLQFVPSVSCLSHRITPVGPEVYFEPNGLSRAPLLQASFKRVLADSPSTSAIQSRIAFSKNMDEMKSSRTKSSFLFDETMLLFDYLMRARHGKMLPMTSYLKTEVDPFSRTSWCPASSPKIDDQSTKRFLRRKLQKFLSRKS